MTEVPLSEMGISLTLLLNLRMLSRLRCLCSISKHGARHQDIKGGGTDVVRCALRRRDVYLGNDRSKRRVQMTERTSGSSPITSCTTRTLASFL